MFSFVSLSILALATSSATGLVVPRSPAAPSTWSNSLEDYATYHIRYLTIGCHKKHNTSFFDRCCHPLQNGSEPNPTCTSPSALVAAPAYSSVAPTAAPPVADPSPTDDDEDDEDCEETDETEDDGTTTVAAAATPTPTPTPAPAPSSTSTSKPSPVPYNAPAPEAKTATSNNVVNAKVSAASDVQTGGFATFFYQNGIAGACGTVHKDSDMIAAIDAGRYGNTGVRSSLCGKRVEITNPKNRKKVTVTIADACPTCRNRNSIDLSTAAFRRIAKEEDGIVPITWKFV